MDGPAGWFSQHPTKQEGRRPNVTAIRVLAIAPILLGLGFVLVMAAHHPQNGLRPNVRITVAGGCPHGIGAAIDVRNPNPSDWLAGISSHPALAPSGATTGLICRYAPDASGGGVLAEQVHLTGTQASLLSVTVAGVHTSRLGNTPPCAPGGSAGPTVVVLGYPHDPDVDIWLNDGSCQSADNGIGLALPRQDGTLGAFSAAVRRYLPPAG